MKTLTLIVLHVLVVLQTCKSEYVWTGDEWKWSEPGESQINTDVGGKSAKSDIGEGSGGGAGGIKSDYDDDEDDYDYDPNEDYDYDPNKPKNDNKNKFEDDEDMGEGSGNDMEEPVYPHGSGGYPKKNPDDFNKPNENIPIDPPYNGYDDPEDEVIIDDQIDPIDDPINVPAPTQKPIENTQAPTTKKTPMDISTEGPNKKRTPNRSTSFFAQPGILAAVIGGAVVGLLCAILLVMFIVYRMRKKDEGSYALDEPKRSPNVNSYSKPPSREFYA